MFIGFGLQNVVSLVGAIAICAMTFYLPFVLHAKASLHRKGMQRYKATVGHRLLGSESAEWAPPSQLCELLHHAGLM